MLLHNLTTFLIYIVGYYVLHSLLTTNFIKEKFDFKWYRLLYNLLAIALLIPIGITLFSVRNEIMNMPFFLRLLGLLALIFGMWVQKVSFNSFSKRVFWGLEESNESEQDLVIDGLYEAVRHPLYFGALMIFTGLTLMFPNEFFLGFAVISIIYIWIGSYLEEQKLIKIHPKYINYRKQVPAIIPYRKTSLFLKYVFEFK